MSTDKKRPASDKLAQLVAQSDVDDAARDLDSQSEEEHAKALAAEGVDLEEERAHMRKLLAARGLLKEPPPKRPAAEKLAQLVAQSDVDDAARDLESQSEEEHAKALAAEGVDLEEERAHMRKLLETRGVVGKAKEEARVVDLASRRVRRSTKMLLLVAAAIALTISSTVAVVATRDDQQDDTRVTSPACLPIESTMTLEGTVARSGDTFVLTLATPLCGENGDRVPDVALDAKPGAADLAALVGRRARIEGRVSTRDASAYVVEVTRATSAPR